MKMSEHFGDKGIIARLGGDEFLIILSDISPYEVEERLKIFSLMPKSLEYQNQSVTYTMSIGYSLFPEQSKSYRELYQNAVWLCTRQKCPAKIPAKNFLLKC